MSKKTAPGMCSFCKKKDKIQESQCASCSQKSPRRPKISWMIPTSEFSSLKTMSRNNNLPYMYSVQPRHHLYNRTEQMNILIHHKVLFFRCFRSWPIDQILICTWHFIQDVCYLLNTIKHVTQQKLEPCILRGCHASHWAYTMTHPLPACLGESLINPHSWRAYWSCKR